MAENAAPIIIGSDHGAYSLKEIIKAYIENLDIDVEDIGTHTEASCNYPDFGIKVAAAVSTGKFKRGILLCGTGLGMSIVANRFSNVRATLCSDIFSARMSRQHNDSNILVIGGRVIGDILAIELVKTWIETPFEGDRHEQRLSIFNGLGEKPENF